MSRQSRRVLVPDTVEWSGQRPWGEDRRYAPIPFVTADGKWELKLGCWDKPKGRVIGISTCTALGTPILPLAEHAWEFLVVAESVADEHLSRGWEISRVDFARDVDIAGSREYLRDFVRRAASQGIPGTAYFEERKLGVTFMGVAGGDRLRIYHKGLETKHKYRSGILLDRKLQDVIRVELQLRRGQLAPEIRKDVQTLRTARAGREPSEHDVPVIGTRPSHRHRIRKRHLWAMKREWHPQRALEATEAVDKFLLEQGLDWLLPDSFGTELPDPLYGWTSQRHAKR